MTGLFGSFDHYVFALVALLGTFAAAFAFFWLSRRSSWAPIIRAHRGLSPPFVNVVGVLFALTLAFLANDTWNAHDRATAAVHRESGALRGIVALAQALPQQDRAAVIAAVRDYAAQSAAEWAELARRADRPQTAESAARIMEILAMPETASGMSAAAHAEILAQAALVRDAREQRLALSQTHVNPLKWLGMAFLGLLTMISIAMVYVDQPKAEMLAVALFAAAAAPTAAIVLIQGNPFQPPGAVSSAPIAALAKG